MTKPALKSEKLLKYPIVRFRGSEKGEWHFSILTMSKGSSAAPVTMKTKDCEAQTPVKIGENGGRTLWRTDCKVPLKDKRQVKYSFNETNFTIEVPALEDKPRFGFASCNGFSDPKVMKGVKEPFERWDHLAGKHKERPLDVLLLGGDQVYSDSIWSEIEELKEWTQLSRAKKLAFKVSPDLQAKIAAFYFDLYSDRWSIDSIGRCLAQIPSVMMWDDHDIFDGWGSYPEDLQKCKVYTAIFEEADKAFMWFQLQASKREDVSQSLNAPGSYGQGFQVGNVAVAVLDLRSERTPDRVMTEGSWQSFYKWLAKLEGCQHLFVVSSIPVVYADFNTIETMLGVFPGQQEIEDDLKDHWQSRTHKGERLRMIHRLLEFGQSKSCRVTILSGDVHVAALGILESNRGAKDGSHVINQLISSAVIHPSPDGKVLLILKLLSEKIEEVDRGITGKMVPFPGTDKKFLPQRNWLSLSEDKKNRIWADWWPEGEAAPYTKVIHQVDQPGTKSV